MIDSFSIFRITDKKGDHLPDYRITAKVDGQYIEIAAGWIKESKGGKFISCKLSKPYGNRPGYTIVPVSEEGAGMPPESPKLPQNEDFSVEIDPDSIDL